MSYGLENVRQLHLLLLLLSGTALASELLATLRSFRYASMSLSGASIEGFVPCTAFAFFVSVVLTFLHVFQWIVASRLRRRFPLWWAGVAKRTTGLKPGIFVGFNGTTEVVPFPKPLFRTSKPQRYSSAGFRENRPQQNLGAMA
jgi:hypothetical protein